MPLEWVKRELGLFNYREWSESSQPFLYSVTDCCPELLRTRETVEIRYTIPRYLHTKLRCKAAEREMTMKDFITRIFEEAVGIRPKM